MWSAVFLQCFCIFRSKSSTQLDNMFDTNVLSNMLLEGSSARVLQRGSPIRPFPRVLLCPLNIPKITIVHGIGCSLNLNISYNYCSFVSWEYWQRLVEYGQAIDLQNLPLSGHPLLQKARTFGLGPPPRPPLISITDFNIRCHLT